MRVEAFTRPSTEDLPIKLETLSSQWRDVLRGWDSLLETRGANEVVQYNAFNGRQFSSSFEEIVRHVVNHGSYHRGQVALMLRQLGHPAIGTDLIAFTRLPI